MKGLAAGHGKGCNFEDEDRFSPASQMAHHAVLWGHSLCFASTASATLLRYFLDAQAPYPFWSVPKLLGVPGGVLLALGALWMAALKLRAERALGNPRVWGGEMGFVLLLTPFGKMAHGFYRMAAILRDDTR